MIVSTLRCVPLSQSREGTCNTRRSSIYLLFRKGSSGSRAPYLSCVTYGISRRHGSCERRQQGWADAGCAQNKANAPSAALITVCSHLSGALCASSLSHHPLTKPFLPLSNTAFVFLSCTPVPWRDDSLPQSRGRPSPTPSPGPGIDTARSSLNSTLPHPSRLPQGPGKMAHTTF